MQGIDLPRVAAWLDSNVEGLRGPYRYTLIAGGRSNLTYLGVDATGAGLSSVAHRSVACWQPPTMWPASTG